MQSGNRSRRDFLKAAAGAVAAGPAFLRQDAARPAIPYGVMSGDVSGSRAIVWSRTDRPARMLVEWAASESFQNARQVRGPVASEATGYTARVDLGGLPRDQRIFFRIRFEDIRDSRAISETAAGTFLSAPSRARDVSLAWSADTVGQGWGINPEFGGLRMYETIRRAEPDIFVHCGDTIYADGPVLPEVPLPDGSVWKNLTTPEKSKVAETLAEFRGNYVYNLLDDNARRFNAAVPQFIIRDDHEVKNNWYPGTDLSADGRYTEKNAGVLAARARQAFLEYSPIRLGAGPTPPIYRSCSYGPLLDLFAIDLRSYRARNSGNRQPAPGADTVHAGAGQLSWLKRSLAASTATWKVIACDLPIGLIVPDGSNAYEGIANGEPGAPLGREHEVADLLRFIRQRNIRNVVWITGDVHYAAAHRYHPDRAGFKDFRPFWEFVAGPLHAGTFGPNALDGTFGPEAMFSSVAAGSKPNQPPSAGQQFFGKAAISAKTRAMTVTLHNLRGDRIYAVELEPEM